MKLRDQVCSLVYAKMLKALGINQESLWYWVQDASDKKWMLRGIKNVYGVAAFTVSELGEMFPMDLEIVSTQNDCFKSALDSYKKLFFKNRWICWNLNQSSYYKILFSNNEANVRAKMLIYLIKKGFLETHKEIIYDPQRT